MSRRFFEAGMYDVFAEAFKGELVVRFKRYIGGTVDISKGEYTKLPQIEEFAMSLGSVNDMELDQPTPTSTGDSKPPKHSCTTEIIAELERLEALPNVYPEKIGKNYTHVEAIFKSAITDRIKYYKAKETHE